MLTGMYFRTEWTFICFLPLLLKIKEIARTLPFSLAVAGYHPKPGNQGFVRQLLPIGAYSGYPSMARATRPFCGLVGQTRDIL